MDGNAMNKKKTATYSLTNNRRSLLLMLASNLLVFCVGYILGANEGYYSGLLGGVADDQDNIHRRLGAQPVKKLHSGGVGNSPLRKNIYKKPAKKKTAPVKKFYRPGQGGSRCR